MISTVQCNLVRRSPVVFILGVTDANSSLSFDYYDALCYLIVES